MSGPSPRRDIRRDSVALGAYVAAFGVSYGALSITAGLSVPQTVILSVVMFTGASQFAFVGIIGSGAAPLAAIPTAVLLGVRNGFYGVPMARILGRDGLRGHRRPLAAQLVVDETTAMAVGRVDVRDQRYAFWTSGVTMFTLWNAGTLVGAVGRSAIGDPAALGLDAAIPASFLALLWPRLADGRARVVALAGAVIATATVPILPAGVPVLAAIPVALVAGLERRPEPVSSTAGEAS